jgi:leader peptidase (prepilin peptidase) / N-methyltransferase
VSAETDDQHGAERSVSDRDLRPDLRILLGGSAAVAAISAASLAWPAAWASTVLGVLMIAGAEVDARTFLLPDVVTGGTLVAGVLAALILNPHDPVPAVAMAASRAIGTASLLWLVRWGYGRLRNRQGLGLGDVKLGAGIGAWLPVDAIPACFALASVSALILVLLARCRGRTVHAATRLPFGALLCPALWAMFYITIWGN